MRRLISLRGWKRSAADGVNPVEEPVSKRMEPDDEQEQPSGAHGDSIGLLILCGRVGEFQVDHSHSDDQGHHQGVPEGLHEGGAEGVRVQFLFAH